VGRGVKVGNGVIDGRVVIVGDGVKVSVGAAEVALGTSVSVAAIACGVALF
jgi:hypothetical protein